MGNRSGESREGHDEHAGSDCCFQFISKNRGKNQKHHHAAACTDKSADQADHCPADKGLQEALLRTDFKHLLLGGHHRLYQKLNAKQNGHVNGKAPHRLRRKEA